jgi:hypothetical protein
MIKVSVDRNVPNPVLVEISSGGNRLRYKEVAELRDKLNAVLPDNGDYAMLADVPTLTDKELLELARREIEDYVDMGCFADPDTAERILVEGFQFGYRAAIKRHFS